MSLFFFLKKVCLKFCLKFTLFDVTSVLPDNLFGLKNNYFQTCAEINTLSFNSSKQMLCKLFFLQHGKAAIGAGLKNKLYLKILQYSQESTCVAVIF